MYSCTFGKGWVGRGSLYFFRYECPLVVFSFQGLTCMHCVYLALWTCKVLCGRFLCAIFKFSPIHSFIHSFIHLFTHSSVNRWPGYWRSCWKRKTIRTTWQSVRGELCHSGELSWITWESRISIVCKVTAKTRAPKRARKMPVKRKQHHLPRSCRRGSCTRFCWHLLKTFWWRWV